MNINPFYYTLRKVSLCVTVLGCVGLREEGGIIVIKTPYLLLNRSKSIGSYSYVNIFFFTKFLLQLIIMQGLKVLGIHFFF